LFDARFLEATMGLTTPPNLRNSGEWPSRAILPGGSQSAERRIGHLETP